MTQSAFCWFPDCDHPHTRRIKLEVFTGEENTMKLEGKFCHEHFLSAWDNEFFPFVKIALKGNKDLTSDWEKESKDNGSGSKKL